MQYKLKEEKPVKQINIKFFQELANLMNFLSYKRKDDNYFVFLSHISFW